MISAQMPPHKPLPPTQVVLTVDTEFSIAGHFDDPRKNTPVSLPLVYGTAHKGGPGLGFILDTLSKYQLRATFFVETANVCYFGDEPMAQVFGDLKSAGQDIQLHVHPVWLSFAHPTADMHFPRQDDCAGQAYEYLERVIRHCQESFIRLSGRRPEAIRTGNLRADLTTYQVIHDSGIPLSSNIAMGVFRPEPASLQLCAGRHRIHGVTELPVLTYRDLPAAGKSHLKSLQITSCAWPEMKFLLQAARRQKVEQVVILTHPFEFFKASDSQYQHTRRNRINQNRLIELCKFIQENDQDFIAADFGQHGKTWMESESSGTTLQVPDYYTLGRKLHNKINDSIWLY